MFESLIQTAQGFTFVKFDGSSLNIKSDTFDQARLALKELRILKKQAQNEKAAITAKYNDIRDEYNQKVGNRSSLAFLTGTGKFGMFARAGVRAVRAAERGQMADIRQIKQEAVQPFENLIATLDKALVAVEARKVAFEAR
jgi:hypothetical protein